ncbi:non-homologous end-joining DNA ligase [Candidatus Parcubacteria bacterium]|nr:non-homologous end-joining DNA ligase [Candidatus Parcubacteria bacterium]
MKKLEFTHLNKVFWPKEKYTKGDVIDYYDKIAPYLLPYLKDRPMVMNRHPNGIKGKSFYQKNADREHLPAFVKTVKIYSESNRKHLEYVVCNNKETLLWLANFGCIELNPWASRTKNLDKPDFLTIDIDPGNRSFDDVIEVALVARTISSKAGLKALVKTSGKKGIHVVIPVGAKYPYEKVRDVAKQLVAIINQQMPELTTLEQRLNKRKGKIYLDIARNNKGQTAASVYSLRPYPGATVSTPLEWREVKKGLHPSSFTIKTIFPRLKKKGDLFKPILK